MRKYLEETKGVFSIAVIVGAVIFFSLLYHKAELLFAFLIIFYSILVKEMDRLPEEIFKDYLPITKKFLAAGFFVIFLLPIYLLLFFLWHWITD